MIDSPLALLEALRARGLMPDAPQVDPVVDIEAHAVPRPKPWFVAALLVVSGWFAGLLVLFFLIMTVGLESTQVVGTIAWVLLLVAWALYAGDREQGGVAQFALALSTAGQCAALWALGKDMVYQNPRAIAAIAVALQLLVGLAMRNHLQRLLCGFFASIAWAALMRIPDDMHGPSEASGGIDWLPALAGGLMAWLPVIALLAWAIRREPNWMAGARQALLRPVLQGMILGLAFGSAASYPVGLGDAFGFALFFLEPVRAASNLLALWPVFSAVLALVGAGMAFALGERALVRICSGGALLHAVHFFFVVGTPLWTRALLAMGLGCGLLLLANALERRTPRPTPETVS